MRKNMSFMPPAARNLFEKRSLDSQKLLINRNVFTPFSSFPLVKSFGKSRNPFSKGFLVLFMLFFLSFIINAQNTGITGSTSINKCETKTYTITIQNNSGNPLTNLMIANDISLLTGFSYVTGSTSISVDSDPAYCTADPVDSGGTLTWTMNSQCSPELTLNDGQTLTISFQLQTDCSAVSGSMNCHFTYEIGGTPSFDDTAYSIQVLPGGVTIKKTPSVISQEVGQNVTWTIAVENTGLGTIKNVKVTDLLGAGLQYVSSTPAGTNSGLTTTWDSSQVSEFVSMDPGDIVTIDITAKVISCNYLDNVADVRWGCDALTDCFNTATDGGTATASVQRIVRSPNTSFTPPDITFSFCTDTSDNSLTITNVGDGTAHGVQLAVDFSPLTVVTSSVPYNAGGYFEIGDIAAGDHYDLTFTLQYNSWCGGADISKSLIWEPSYKDDCGNDFFPPIEASVINSIVGTPSLSVTKTGASDVIQIGDVVSYNITSSYSGDISCGSGSAGLVTVVDTIPDGFTVTDADGGTWVPGGNGTGGTVTWTYTPPASLSKTLILQSPLRTDCETYCFTTFTNTVTATGTDCCGCSRTATASQTSAIQCEELATVSKTATPSTTERCSSILYTNTYTFSASANVNLSDLVFADMAENQQQYVPGSLSVVFDGSNITGCVVPTDGTPGGTFSLDFSGCGATSVNSKVLVISYQLTITSATAPACSSTGFYSWSRMHIANTGSECLGDGTIYEAVLVSVQPPAMSVDISGLPRIVDKCKTQTVTITLTQTSSIANPRDVRLVLSGLNYYVVNPAATVCGGTVSPVSCTPTIVGDDYEWVFNDGFDGVGKTATVELTVQKRCTGTGDLVATAYFDDKCNDDATPDNICSTSDTAAPAVLLSGDLLIEKTPEVYYAATNSVQWKIYVTNRGTGSAYNTYVDDVLGSGLIYDIIHPATVNDMTGVTVIANQDHSGAVINGATILIAEMAAGERREITYNATLVDCNNLTNDVTSSWGCVGLNCQTPVTDHATVEIPAPLLVNTNVVVTPIDACTSPTATVTLRNAGQTTCYNLQVTETLPTGLTFRSGSVRWRVNSGAWNGPDVAYNPNPTTSPIVWTKNEISAFSSITPGDTIELEFALDSTCPFAGGTVTVSTQYENPCGNVFTNANSTFAVTLKAPVLNVTKTRVDNPVGCGETVNWTITVENQSGYTLPIVWVEDTMDAAYSFVSSTGDGVYSGDNGTNSGQVVTWELTNLIHGATATLTLTATTDSFPCSADLDNTVRAWWGCGAADGSSSTKPGTDAPDNTLCLTSASSSDVRTETRQPTIANMSVNLSPASISSCKQSTTVTLELENTGTTDASNLDIVITLPTGLSYNAGSAELYVGADNTGATVSIADPTIVGNQLRFTDTASKINNLTDTLQASGGNDTLVLKFSVQSSCYATANMGYTIYYYDCCGDQQYTNTGTQQIISLYPSLTVTKTPTTAQIACGAQQTWTITVNNTGTGNAQVVRVEDTPGSWITVDQASSTAGLTDMGGGVWGWEINDLAAGNSQTFTLVGTLNVGGNDCTTSLRQNNVRAIWGCGTTGETVDSDPTTTTYDCTYGTWSNATASTLQLPNLTIGTVTPSATCSADGTFTGSITVQVNNTGNGTTGGTSFVIQASDGKGWTGTYTYTGTIAAGGTANIVVPGSSWSPAWVPACTTCSPASPYSFNITVDQTGTICECNEGDNTSTGTTLNVYRPELSVSDIIFTGVSCTSDHISGTIQVKIDNTGCANATNAVVRLTTDCGLTFTNRTVNVTAGSSTTTTFTISTGSWTSCTSGTCNFTATVDPSNAICECAGSSHSLTEALPSSYRIPDLNAVSLSASASCSADGSLNGTIDVTLSNIGPVAINTDFRISVNDGQGWTSELRYNADLGGTLPINPGDSNTVTFNWTRNFSGTPYTCSFPTITATVDSQNAICECTNTNNQTSGSYSLTTPNLRVVSVTPSCTSDGTYSIAVVVDNNGCSNIGTSFTVHLADDDGHSATQTVNSLNAGAQQTLTFSNWPADGTPSTIEFTATVDYGSSICELTSTDNSSSTTYTRPNLHLMSITPECTADGTYRVRVTIENNGSAANNTDFSISISDDDGHSSEATFTSLGGTLPINAGTQQTVTFTGWTVDCSPTTINFSGTIDSQSNVCESNSSDNTGTGQLIINDLQPTNVTASTSCSADGTITGTIAVTVTNNGGQAITNDFHISVNDGQGWTDELLYNADLGGTLPIAAGSTGTATFSWTRGFTTTPYTCSFPSISVAVDSQNEICECNSANNTASGSYSMNYPDLNVVSITPSCSDDSDYSISVVVRNSGCGTASNFVVRLSDNDGHSATQTITSLASGAQQTLTFSNWPTDGNPTSLDFTAEVDSTGVVCELDGSNNSTTTSSYTRPNLHVVSLTPSVNTDSDYQVSLVIENNGSEDINTDFTITITDNDGHSRQVSFTSLGGTLPFAAGTQQTLIIGSWTVDCNPTTINFSVTIDSQDNICESNDSDNTGTGQIIINNLEATSVSASASCTADGSLSGTIAVTLTNRGGQAINDDFSISVSDGQGWSSELHYNADLGGTLPLAAGASRTVTFTWGRNFTATPYVCSFPTITAQVDTQNDIYECSTSDNQTTSTYSLSSPDLSISSITPSCTSDGTYSIDVVIENTGCGTASNFVLQLSDNDSHTQTQTITSLASGSQQTVTFSSWPADGNPTSLIFNATIDSTSTVCELDGTNNTFTTPAYTRPNIHMISVTPTCVGDSNYQVAIVLENNGSQDIAGDFYVQLTDNDSHSSEVLFTSIGGTLPFTAGSQQTVTFTGWTVDCNPTTINFNATTDSQNQVCESNSSDNTGTAQIIINNLEATSTSASASCTSEGNVSGTISVTVTNRGGQAINDDFSILVNDGNGWSSELRYNADLGGTLPLAAGASRTVTFNWTRNFTATPFVCSFNNITAQVDSQSDICECTTTDNQTTTTYTLPVPNLTISNVATSIICNNDGSLTGTTVAVTNNSCADASNVLVRLSSDCGLTFTDQTVNVPAGQTVDVFFAFTSGIIVCTCDFTAVVDPENTICELDGTDNTGASTQTMLIPDITVQEEAMAISCISDGVIRISGRVTIANAGCGPDFTSNIPMRFTLFSNTGCRGTRIAQWTDTFTGVSIPSSSGTQSFTIHPQDITTDFYSNSTNCQVSILIEADYSNTICEWDGTNNAYCTNKTSDCLDLLAEKVTASTTCKSDGTIAGTIAVTVRNNGGKPVNTDFYISIDDGKGWTSEKRYNADLGGKLPLNAGETSTVTFNWTRNFTAKPFTCDLNTITAVVDSRNTICEGIADNNSISTSYRLLFPDIHIKSFLTTCSSDGLRQLQTTIGNDGCGPLTNDFNITYTDNTGQTRTQTFTQLGGTLPLNENQTQTVVLDRWNFDCDSSSTQYTISLDLTGICDLDNTNNSSQFTLTANDPDLIIDTITGNCNTDGSINFTATITNAGYGTASGAQLTVYDNDNTRIYLESITLGKGESRQVTFTSGKYPKGQPLNFRFVVDEANSICECNGQNNTKSYTINCPLPGGKPKIDATTNCSPGQQQGGLFKYEIQVTNPGETDLTDVTVEDTLPAGFQYVPNSSSLGGVSIPDPVPGPPLSWKIPELKTGASLTLLFTAVADADLEPGQYCNETHTTGTVKGSTETVSSETSRCCSVVTRQTGGACCLNLDGRLISILQRPEGPISYIEPYFHTQSAMYTVYAALKLWNSTPTEKETMPDFMKERLLNYSRSTIDEFYFGSRLGLALPDGSLWLSYAGAYPEQDEKARENNVLLWTPKQVDKTMTASQIGFELLGLNEAAKSENRHDVKLRLKDIIMKKLDFIAAFIDQLPHAWEIDIKSDNKKEKGATRFVTDIQTAIRDYIKKSDEKANLFDYTTLYLAVTELRKSGYTSAETLENKLRELTKTLDNNQFTSQYTREEFLYILTLLENGQSELAKSKITDFERLLDIEDNDKEKEKNSETQDKNNRNTDSKVRLQNLHDYALAATVDYKAGGNRFDEIKERMTKKFYLKDIGIFADVQPDFTFKLNLESMAALMLYFDTQKTTERDADASIIYRSFDEVGLFLKKRNLTMGYSLYSLLKNYPFSEPLMPVLTFTRAKQNIAPVFSKDTVIHSTQVNPLGEIEIPQLFSKILSPGYETNPSRIAELSFGFQYFGRLLMEDKEKVNSEEGRSFDETGKKYIDSLIHSGAGLLSDGLTLLPYDNMAIKGPKKGPFDLEPLNSGTRFSTETLANYMLAEKYYAYGQGKYSDQVRRLILSQFDIVQKFAELEYIPQTFDLFIDPQTKQITVIPSKEHASRLTLAKLIQSAPQVTRMLFLEEQMESAPCKLIPEDLIFLTSVPHLLNHFKNEIAEFINKKDPKVAESAADVIARQLLGQTPEKISESLKNLEKHWDNDAVLPRSDRIEHIERGLILHHEPRQFLLYLLATSQEKNFRFKRTLNFFTYMLENEWGVRNEDENRFMTLPSFDYQVFKEEPREEVEPGDLLNFKLRVDNTCPQGYGKGHDIPSLFIKSTFTPPLIYSGTRFTENLDFLGDFQWRYNGLNEGTAFEFNYQAFVPYDWNYGYFDGTITANGRQGFQDFGTDTASGDMCEDTLHLKRMNIRPFSPIQGIVFEDRNVNGTKEAGEPGIPNILIKDTRGRIFRSDAEGRFSVLAGDDHEAIQLELRSIPVNYLMIDEPTRLVNRYYTGEIYFGLIPCKTLTGFVYIDENGNNTPDENEIRPAGVILKAKDKEVVTGQNGEFIFRNLPIMWQEWIKVHDNQLFNKGDLKKLKFKFNETDK